MTVRGVAYRRLGARRASFTTVLGLLVGLAAVSPAARAVDATRRSIGTPIVTDQSTAPWSVLLSIARADGGVSHCSGSVIDPAHVVTAAHCTRFGSEMPPPAAFTAHAGIPSYWAAAADHSAEQVRDVAAVRVHPGYGASPYADDLAILTLAAPLAIGSEVAPIAIARTAPSVGSAVQLVGFGQIDDNTFDATEHVLDTTLLPDIGCYGGVPAVLCHRTANAASCPGDSGAGVVTRTVPPAVFAVNSLSVEGGCTAGNRGGAIDLTSPEIAVWLAGDDAPPMGPRATTQTTMSGDPNIGDSLTCHPSRWTGSPSTRVAFIDNDTFASLQSGDSATYVVPPSDLGRNIACVSIATNSGGTTQYRSGAYAIAPGRDPKLTLSIDRVGRMTITLGAIVSVRLTLRFTRRDGRVASRQTFADDDAPSVVPRLSPDVYRACLSFPQTRGYRADESCVEWSQDGDASRLLEVSAKRKVSGRRFRVTLHTPAGYGLRGKRVHARWLVTSCRGCRTTSYRRTFRLSTVNHLTSPAVPRRHFVDLVISMPTGRRSGVRYVGNGLSIAFGRR
jgi:hypothetical protein